jgi:hypothetical protein
MIEKGIIDFFESALGEKKCTADYLAPKSIYNSLCGAPENVPCITVPSDHSH